MSFATPEQTAPSRKVESPSAARALTVATGRSATQSRSNQKYRVPGFLATSFSEDKARDFAHTNGTAFGRPAVLWVVHVDPRGRNDPAFRCKHVNFVRHSLVHGEHEYLFTGYSVFTQCTQVRVSRGR